MPPRQPVDFYGSLNQSKAVTIAMARLREESWTAKEQFSGPPYEHELLGQYDLIYQKRECTLLAFKTRPQQSFDCHPRAPYLSFFPFEKRANGWKLIHQEIGVGRLPNERSERLGRRRRGVWRFHNLGLHRAGHHYRDNNGLCAGRRCLSRDTQRAAWAIMVDHLRNKAHAYGNL